LSVKGGDRVRRRVIAHGRVQGVGFREALREKAQNVGVAGWVRNRVDGCVEAALEGPSVQVEEVVGWCADGPEAAKVNRLDVIEESPLGVMGFQVKRV
jgi:acylphosphatase